jgi:hypothetical protein
VAVLVAVLVVPAGCGGNCATNCPPATVYIGNLDNQQLYINNIVVDGPACPPPEAVYCVGDGYTHRCTHVTITGRAQGYCDVAFIFPDRPTMFVRTEFGPPITQGCCKGYTIVGDSVFVIPANPDAGISGADGGGTDAITDAARPPVDGGARDASDDASDDAADGN